MGGAKGGWVLAARSVDIDSYIGPCRAAKMQTALGGVLQVAQVSGPSKDDHEW